MVTRRLRHDIIFETPYVGDSLEKLRDALRKHPFDRHTYEYEVIGIIKSTPSSTWVSSGSGQ